MEMQPEKPRVVITGIGAVTSIGVGVDGLWSGIVSNRSGISAITAFDASGFRTRVAGEVRGFDGSGFVSQKNRKRLDRFATFAVAAARMAAEDGGLDLACYPEAGIVMGSALGGLGFAETQHDVYRDRGLKAVHPALALLVFGASSSCHIAIELGLTGPNITNSNSCASGTMAVGEAFEMIRAGRAKVILAGGAEAPLYPLTFASFTIIKAMTARNDDPEGSCRPFDSGRDGFVMGEGAAVLVMEDMDHALMRGARIYAEVTGYGLTNDAFHMTSSRDDGECAARAVGIALAQAGIRPGDIGYINAHGSSTSMNDKNETTAVKKALGEHAYKIPMSSTKPFHAHPLGATGAIEAAVCALAIRNEYLPPTLNLTDPDPDCDLDYIPLVGRRAKVDNVLSNSFGFGGMNAAIVFGRVD
jgi:3-oxoacyl-[acyl-carrier-protein] synthase II